MTDVVLLEAALFQLRAAAASITDEMFASQLNLATSVLGNTIAAAGESLNASTVNDVEFALSDLAAVVDELSAADAQMIAPAVELLRQDVARLKEETSLSADVMTTIAALQAKLKARRSAIERNLYRAEGSPEQTPPHPADELREDAIPLRDALAAAGFATPALDALIEEPASLVFQSLRDISDELEVITG
ncbi:MAG: hypothetical protein QOI24_287 [Acidobacteriota bacterium]|jgi:hypothetical protein|nr:hypothetical protein [Acidobacteriota bacterium]